MIRVAALYRYPVKGFRPQSCEVITVLAEGRVAGDRVLGFRFANAGSPGNDWGSKHEFAVGVNTPVIPSLSCRLEAGDRRLVIHDDAGQVIALGDLDEAGRAGIAAAFERYLLGIQGNPLEAHPQRSPLRLVGCVDVPRHQDSSRGQVTLHGRESLASLGHALGDPALDERRFRSNVAIEGLEAWAELDWVGRRLRIGEVVLHAVAAKVRCAATHANPETGQRDRPVLRVLADHFGHEKPTFAIGMLAAGPGGCIRVGDEVHVLD